MRFLSHPGPRFHCATLAATGFLLASLLLTVNAAIAEEPKVKDVLEQEEVKAEKPEETEKKQQGPVDEFNRGTPRSSFKNLAEAMAEADYERAAEYLDLRNLRQNILTIGGPELARQLKVILDRGLWVDVDTLSRDPEGLTDDGLPAYRDSLDRQEDSRAPRELQLWTDRREALDHCPQS